MISSANLQKQALSKDILQLEQAIRQKRDRVADLQVHNRSLQYLIDRQSDISQMKDSLENRALNVISEDMSEQLEIIQANAEKLTGKVTPFGMEQLL